MCGFSPIISTEGYSTRANHQKMEKSSNCSDSLRFLSADLFFFFVFFSVLNFRWLLSTSNRVAMFIKVHSCSRRKPAGDVVLLIFFFQLTVSKREGAVSSR